MSQFSVPLVKRLSHGAMLALYGLPEICMAIVEKETETRPDGATLTREVTKFYPPERTSDSIIIGIVVVFGGIIALFGIKLLLRSMELGRDAGVADISIDASKKTFRLRKLAQGAVVTLIGAAIMLGALFFMTR